MLNKFSGAFLCSAVMMFLSLHAADMKVEFKNGILDAAAPGFTYLEKAVTLPAEGSIDFDFKPEYGLEKKHPERKAFTYYLFDARTAKGGIFVALHVPENKQTAICFYGQNPAKNGKIVGGMGKFPVARGKWCHISVRWSEKYFRLLVDGKVAVYASLLSIPDFRMELPATIKIGGGKFAPSAYGKFRNFVIRDLSVKKTVIEAKPAVSELTVFNEKKDLLHVVAESPASVSKLTIRPVTFSVRKGKRYFVYFPNAVPYEVTAEKDGELVVDFPKRHRADMIIAPAEGGNLLKDGSFEKAQLDWKGGKTAAVARSGKQSLQLTLGKFGGTVQAESPEFTLVNGKDYLFSVFYRQKDTRDDTMFGSYIFLYKDGKPAGRLAAADYEYNNFPKTINAESSWHYSTLRVRIPADWKNSKVTAKIFFRVTGHPGTVFFDDADWRIAFPEIREMAGKVVNIKPLMNEKQLLAHLAKHPGYRAKIVRHNDAPALSINGKIVPPVPLCSWNSSLAATAREQGLDIIKLSIPVTYWGVDKYAVWKGKNRYDFSLIDEEFKKVLKHHPDAKILIALGGNYTNISKDLPKSRWVNRAGKPSITRNTSVAGYAVSLISDEVRRECSEAYRRIAEHIAASPYGKSVIGCKITFGGDGQWYPADFPWTFKNMDYSEGSRLSVCNRIRMMYKNDLAALRKAWKDDKITFETIRIPSFKELCVAEKKRVLDPADPTHRRLMDCVLAYHQEIIKSIEIYCSAVKKGMGKDIITGTYYTENSGMGHEELHKTREIDFYSLPGLYMRQRNMGGYSTVRVPLGSSRLHNKFFFEEVDYRNDYSNSRDFSERQYLGLTLDSSPKEAADQLRRAFGGVMTQGHTGWFMTMGQRCHFTWYGPYAPVMKEVVNAFRINAANRIKDQWPGMVIFHDEKLPLYFTSQDNYDQEIRYVSRFFPGDCGVAAQHYYLSDLCNPKRPGSKLYIFASALKLTEEELQYIEKNLQKNGNVLVFFNDAGALSAGGFEKNIRRLTGMNIRLRPEITVSALVSGEKNCRITSTLPAYSLYCSGMKMPLHYIDDPQATVLARYFNSNYVAGAMKKHANWTAVYFGSCPELTLNSNTLRELAQYAGIKPFAPLGDVSAAGNGLLMIHARYSGEKTLQWQEKCDLIDLATGKKVVRNADRYTFRMKAGETRWFKQAKH